MAIGGYTTAILVADHGWPELATIPVAGLVAGAAGVLFGIPATRLSGLYLALATFGIAIATPAVLKEYSGFTGGVVGKTLPLHDNDWLYYVDWTVALILLALAWLLLSGKLGRAFRALRDSEVAAASSGIDLSAAQDGRVRRSPRSTPASPGRCSRSRSRSSTPTPTRSSSRSSSSSAPSRRASARSGASRSAPR